MVSGLAHVLEAIPDVWKAITALGGAVALGSTVTVASLRFGSLPAQMQVTHDIATRNSAAIVVLEERALDQNRKLDRVICMLALPDSIRPIMAERECR